MGPKTLALKNARSRFDPSNNISDHAMIVEEQPLPFPISLLSFTPEALSGRISDFANKHRAWTVAADETGLLPVLFKLRDLYVGGVGAQSIMPGDTDFEVLKYVPLGRKIESLGRNYGWFWPSHCSRSSCRWWRCVTGPKQCLYSVEVLYCLLIIYDDVSF
jgi:hypothetical protein